MKYRNILQIKNDMYPFSSTFANNSIKNHEIIVKQRIYYKNKIQSEDVKYKLKQLQRLKHKNIINLKKICQISRDKTDLFYSYVPNQISQISFCSYLEIKNIHEQLIRMIIYAAKNSIITSFNPRRIGFKISNGQTIIKYFFLLSQSTIQHDRVKIQRNLKLFSLQSMQYLDQLVSKKASVRSQHNSKNKLMTFSTKQTKPQYHSRNIFSQRIIEDNFNKRSLGCHQQSYKSFNSTKSTFEKSMDKDSSKQKVNGQGISYKSSVQKYLQKKEYLMNKMQKIKQRSFKALNTLKSINHQLKSTSKSKGRKYTLDFDSIKRYSLQKSLHYRLRKS